MAFNQIPKIEDVTHYFDMALTRAKKTMSESYESTKSAVKDVDHIDRLKQLNKAKLQTIRDTLDKQILLILKAFPSFDQLDEFYQQLVRETMDYPEVKKSLGGLQWARGKIDDFTSMYQKKVRGSRTPADIRKHVTEYIGRCASLFKQLKSNLKTLELARQVLRDYPHIKTGMFTVDFQM
jgi:GTP1/Obg family GTP-binding protein